MIANMIKYSALGLVLIGCIVAEPGDRMPNHPNCHDPEPNLPVYFVHPTNCSRFYECKGKDAWEFECPAGLHFNTKINVCDFPANAQCEGQSTVPPTNPTTTTQAATTTNNPTTTENPTTTTQGTTSTTNSPTTTEGITSTETTTTEEITSTTSRPTTTEGTTSAETTTTEEITITTSRPTPTEGTTWTGTTTTEDVSTSNPDITTTSDPDSTSGTTGTTESIKDCGSTHPNYYPYETDCTKYIGCQENCVQYFKCPEGLYWNNLQKRCDVFANSQCPCPIIPPAPNVWTETIDRTTRMDCYEGYC